MRKVAICVLALTSVTGCATVSMVPGQAIVETKVTTEQSQLREVCDAYVKQANAEHWVTPSGGLLDFAKVLIDGSSDKADRRSYDQHIEADTAPPAMLYSRIFADISSARNGLDVVTAQAMTFLETGPVSKADLRKDIVSFEEALIAAQKSRRSFAEAISIVAERGDEGLILSETALAEFDFAIDEARKTADRLALAKTTNLKDSAIS